jgi:hypothetical protein
MLKAVQASQPIKPATPPPMTPLERRKSEASRPPILEQLSSIVNETEVAKKLEPIRELSYPASLDRIGSSNEWPKGRGDPRSPAARSPIERKRRDGEKPRVSFQGNTPVKKLTTPTAFGNDTPNITGRNTKVGSIRVKRHESTGNPGREWRKITFDGDVTNTVLMNDTTKVLHNKVSPRYFKEVKQLVQESGMIQTSPANLLTYEAKHLWVSGDPVKTACSILDDMSKRRGEDVKVREPTPGTDDDTFVELFLPTGNGQFNWPTLNAATALHLYTEFDDDDDIRIYQQWILNNSWRTVHGAPFAIFFVPRDEVGEPTRITMRDAIGDRDDVCVSLDCRGIPPSKFYTYMVAHQAVLQANQTEMNLRALVRTLFSN